MDEKEIYSDVCIRKVRILKGKAREAAESVGAKDDDLVILRTSEYHSEPTYTAEKIKGDPVGYLIEYFMKKKETAQYDNDVREINKSAIIDELEDPLGLEESAGIYIRAAAQNIVKLEYNIKPDELKKIMDEWIKKNFLDIIEGVEE